MTPLKGRRNAVKARPVAETQRRRSALASPAAGVTPAAAGKVATVPLRLPRVAKGQRAQFFSDSGTDQLFGIVTALAAELSVAFERIETLERVLEKRGSLQRTELEKHVPGVEEMAQRAVAREALIERVFLVLERYAEPD